MRPLNGFETKPLLNLGEQPKACGTAAFEL
jgi:hypothetical protein